MIESRDRSLVQRWRVRPESWWWISGVVVLPVLVLTGIAVLILLVTTHPTSTADQLDVVKIALSVGAGTGGVVTLVLAWRRQWHVEKAQQATEKAQQAAEHDATERRITELYGKAVEQLGSEKAPVRLGGLYALERLAQDNPQQRTNVVNVLCAYLRMPYTPPGPAPADDAPPDMRDVHEERVAERQVRLAAQDILSEHVRPGNSSTFWTDTDLNLVGAHLININLSKCRIRDTRFVGAEFIGYAGFYGAEFTGNTEFNGAKFTGHTDFDSAEFTGNTDFDGAKFTGNTEFMGAKFNSIAWFYGAEFTGDAEFMGAKFTGYARFQDAKFNSFAWFYGAEFNSDARFQDAKFNSDTGFADARFTRVPTFIGTRFASYNGDSFWVCLDENEDGEGLFPAGWSVASSGARPEGVTEGMWVTVKPVPSPPDDPDSAEEER